MSAKLPTYVQQHLRTENRHAVLPLQYQEAVKALKACQKIDDGKLWAQRADALAAWARIYKHDEAGLQARRLKLLAYRRMGQIAETLRPTAEKTSFKKPGAHSLLREHGLSQHHARAALNLSRAEADEFERTIEKAPGLHPAARQFVGRGNAARQVSSEAYALLVNKSLPDSANLSSLISWIKKRDPRELAEQLRPDEAERVRRFALDLVDWFDELERALPKTDQS